MKNTKEEFSEYYKRPESPDEKIRNVLDIIQKHWKNHKGIELHLSIIEAEIDRALFLGRLRRLNDDMQHEDRRINKLIEKVVRVVYKERDAPEGGNIEYINDDVRGEVDKILKTYLDLSIGERLEKSLAGQTSERLSIWNHKHFMSRMAQGVGDLFSRDGKLEINYLDSIGTIFFDLNGLKAINDRSVGGYEAGDRALKAMATALCDKDLKQWLGLKGIELIPTHHHGDEFILGIIGNKETDLTIEVESFIGAKGEQIKAMSLIKYIGEYINKKIETTSTKNILDFSDAVQLKRFKDLQEELPEDLALDKNFKYKLSCSYGYTTLKDVIARSVEDEFDFDGTKPVGDKNSGKKIDYEYSIYRMVGKGLIGMSEEKLHIAKQLDRQKRVSSSDLTERLSEILYRLGRNDNEKKIAQVTEKLKEVIIKYNRKIKKERSRRGRKEQAKNILIANYEITIGKLREELQRVQNKLNSLDKK